MAMMKERFEPLEASYMSYNGTPPVLQQHNTTIHFILQLFSFSIILAPCYSVSTLLRCFSRQCIDVVHLFSIPFLAGAHFCCPWPSAIQRHISWKYGCRD